MNLSHKRKTPEPKTQPGLGLIEPDRKLLNAIKSKKEMAISAFDLKKEVFLPNPVFNKSIKSLVTTGLIKEVVNVQFKGRKHYIASEFKPSEEITGGSWYADNGELDQALINTLKDICLKIIRKEKVVTADGVYKFLMSKDLMKIDCTIQRITEILSSMVLDYMIIEVKSTGLGEYYSIPIGEICYRLPGDLGQGVKTGAMASFPCGVCPRIRQCTPDGIISPSTCDYYNKWLDF